MTKSPNSLVIGRLEFGHCLVIVIWCLVIALFSTGFASSDKQPVTVELAAEDASVAPGGSAKIDARFRIKPGWHIYGEHPGDAGLPLTIAWSASRPANVKFGPIVWPAPQQFVDPGDLKTSGYKGTVVLSSAMRFVGWNTPGPDVNGPVPTAVSIHAKVGWLACKELCVPGSAQLDLLLPVGTAP